MTDFWTTTKIKATRKPHRCEWCGKPIEQGSPAVRSSGVFEGEFQSRIAHVDCEDVVIEYHKICGCSWDDEPYTLSDIVGERDNWPWLLENYPEVAERVGLKELMEETGK